jgi:hypothetical protein
VSGFGSWALACESHGFACGRIATFATIGSGVLADQENRLWIPRALTALPPLARVFDVVARSGKLVDRVKVDPSVAIVGFGPGGNVYLVVRDGGAARLQRVRFK